MIWAASANALPALQLGPGSGSDWSYCTTTCSAGSNTWEWSGGDTFDLNAYANANKDFGGNGQYAWDSVGATDQLAYLVVSSIPDLGQDPPMPIIERFVVTIVNDAVPLALYASGYGTPPINDPNSISPHGIFDTYFEIYQFQFGDPLDTPPFSVTSLIPNTEPGCVGVDCDPGQGYLEVTNITLKDVGDGVTGVHFDLLTVAGAGWDASAPDDKKLVFAVAPFSHDASIRLSEPGTLGLMLIGFIGVCVSRARRIIRYFWCGA